MARHLGETGNLVVGNDLQLRQRLLSYFYRLGVIQRERKPTTASRRFSLGSVFKRMLRFGFGVVRFVKRFKSQLLALGAYFNDFLYRIMLGTREPWIL
jgi:hypothetical protein